MLLVNRTLRACMLEDNQEYRGLLLILLTVSPLNYCKALILDMLDKSILFTIQYIIHLHVILRCFI